MIAQQIKMMVEQYRPDQHLKWMESLGSYHLTESQFAHFVGKCRMYNHVLERKSIPEVLITDSQINAVVRGYYVDPHFASRNAQISLWSLYNLLTEANKSSYIDGFVDRGVNGEAITSELMRSISGSKFSWLLE
jgi:hypothetical protein